MKKYIYFISSTAFSLDATINKHDNENENDNELTKILDDFDNHKANILSNNVPDGYKASINRKDMDGKRRHS